MRLSDVNAINDYKTLTEGEEAMKARNLSGWTLYYHHYAKNKRDAQVIITKSRRTGEIVSLSSSDDSDFDSEDEPVETATNNITIDFPVVLHQMNIAAKKWSNESHLVQQAWKKCAAFLNKRKKLGLFETIPDSLAHQKPEFIVKSDL